MNPHDAQRLDEDAGRFERSKFLAREDVVRVRVQMSARIVAGIVANPRHWDGPDPEGSAARMAWAIAGKLLLMAHSEGC